MTNFQVIHDLPALAAAWKGVETFIPLRPIRSKEQADRMHAVAEDLIDVVGDDEEHPLSPLLLLVASLIEAWERTNVQVPDVPPHQVLRFLLEEHKLKQKDLADIASPSLVSAIIAGERPISKRLAKLLAARFHVSPSVFL
jgi:HTH-type transcriptional regulator/antitoxin HigA